MSNDMTNKSGGRSLSQDIVNSLKAGIREHRATTVIVGGKPLLRLLKAGTWVFGQNDDPVQEGSEWAVNPLSIRHGYVCWSDYPGNTKNEMLGEVLTPINQSKPPMPEAVNSFPWKEQSVFELRCISGEDEGKEVLYKGSSIGATRAVDALFAQIDHQLDVDSEHPVAIVQLLATDYQHSKWGQTFNPIFEVTGWATMTGEFDEPAVEQAPEAAQEQPAPAPVTPPQPQPQPQPQPSAQTQTRAAKPPLHAVPPVQPDARPGAAPRRQRPVERA